MAEAKKRTHSRKPRSFPGDTRPYQQKTMNVSFSFYPGDDELLDYIVEFLGSNRSDAARAAIRSFAALCQSVSKRR